MNALTQVNQDNREYQGPTLVHSLNSKSIYNRLKDREAILALVGLGYVGLPIALEFAKDFEVIGFDINESRIDLMRNNIDPSGEVEPETFVNKTIHFTAARETLDKAEVYIVTVPTPVDKNNHPDLTPIIKACRSLGVSLGKGNIVVFESTVYPGCTEEVCVPILEEVSGLKYNEDFKVGYSPERINPGDKVNTLTKIKKIVSGSDEEAAKEIYNIYNHIIEAGIHLAPRIKVAEAAKIVENAQRDVNIGFMNELSILFNELGINTHDVLAAAGTKWNFLNFYPGLVGGHCIGVDPYYLIHKAHQHNVELPIISSSRKVNDWMHHAVADNLEKKLGDFGKKLNECKILFLGMTFKENVSDLRNSKPAFLAKELSDRGANLDIVDPHASKKEMNQYYQLNLEDNISNGYDAVVYAVNHREFEELDCHSVVELVNDKAVIYDFKNLLGNKWETEKSIQYVTL